MAHEGLWNQLLELEPQSTAERAACRYIPDQNRYVLTMLEKDYVIDLKEKNIFSGQSDDAIEPAGFLEQLCLLTYLINSQNLPLAGKLVRPENLPSGQFFFRGQHSMPTEDVKNAFGDCPEQLYSASDCFDATKCDFGDASIELRVFPRVPVTFVVWQGDEEFDARASILLDETVSSQLPLDALLTAVKIAVGMMVENCQQAE